MEGVFEAVSQILYYTICVKDSGQAMAKKLPKMMKMKCTVNVENV